MTRRALTLDLTIAQLGAEPPLSDGRRASPARVICPIRGARVIDCGPRALKNHGTTAARSATSEEDPPP